jgi:hypothetical protein
LLINRLSFLGWPVDPLPLAMARKPRELTADERARFQVDPRR